ncbi:hypothetical protein CSA56_09865 [candidate division KSB3 bacterium]|uniref:Tetratricopeptide repeat protein n=1 Tax=candidate division KSB3 bacterium TaxID=2044937 RepID=A0A2G6KG73_9BACT|nr:MAG: hypothetical protein CSA56_09865 [candidate division KSB3 bacterium]
MLRVSVFAGMIVFALFALSGCYGRSHYATMGDVQRAVQTGDYDHAEQLVKEKEELQSTRNDLLYALELGVLHHLNGKYAESNSWLETAAARMEELDRISISGTTSDWIFSEKFHPYRGEDFERVFVHYYMTLNYLMLGQLQEALVECRRVNTLLQYLNSRYEHKNVYKTDAFILYLSGLIYDALGEINDAFIDYRRAYQTYLGDYRQYYATPPPSQLLAQLLRTTAALGFSDIFETYRADFSTQQWPTQDEYRDSARLVVIWNKGLTPYKTERSFRWNSGGHDWLKEDDPGCYLKFSFAEFIPRPETFSRANISINGKVQSLELAEDVGRIAIKNLEDRRLRTVMQAVSRNTIKCVGQHEWLDDTAWVWRWLYAGAVELTEGVDLRHWFLLPAEVHIAQLLVEPGLTDVEFSFLDAAGRCAKQVLYKDVRLEHGKTTFLIHRTF